MRLTSFLELVYRSLGVVFSRSYNTPVSVVNSSNCFQLRDTRLSLQSLRRVPVLISRTGILTNFFSDDKDLTSPVNANKAADRLRGTKSLLCFEKYDSSR
jgi:hypothetical protein